MESNLNCLQDNEFDRDLFIKLLSRECAFKKCCKSYKKGKRCRKCPKD